MLETIGLIIAVTGTVYLIFIGQKGLVELWGERQKKRKKNNIQSESEEKPVEIISNLQSRLELVGRIKEIIDIKEAIESKEPLVVIAGKRGSGKTAIALEMAHRYFEIAKTTEPGTKPTACNFGAFIWVNARYQQVSLDAVLNTIGFLLEYPVIGTLTGEEKRIRARKIMREKRVFVFIDNFDTLKKEYSSPIIEFLYSLPDGCKALITTRYHKEIKGKVVMIDNLNPADGIDFIRIEAKRHSLDYISNASDDVLDDLVQATGGSPLAIEWAVGQMKRKGYALDTIIANMNKGKADIFETLFSQAWNHLDENAKKLLIATTIFRTSAKLNTIQVASGLTEGEVNEALPSLVELMLLEVSPSITQRKTRYSLHPLTHLFVLNRKEEFEGLVERANEFAVVYYTKLIRDHWEDAKGIEPDLDNIFYLSSWCKQAQKWGELLGLADVIYDILFSLGLFEERIALAYDAVEAAQNLSKLEMEAHFLAVVASTYSLIGEYSKAEHELNKGLQAARAAQDEGEIARILRCFAFNSYRSGDFISAKKYLEGIPEMALRANDKRNYVDILCVKGALEFYTGDYTSAMKTQKHVKEVIYEIGWERGKSYPLRDMAELHMLEQDFRMAEILLNEALDISEEYRDVRQAGRVEMSLTKLMMYLGKPSKAKEYSSRGLDKFERLGANNELNELKAIHKHLTKWPGFLWSLFAKFTNPIPFYSNTPVGGD